MSASSSRAPSQRREQADRSSYTAGQALVGVVNDPRDTNTTWWGFKAQDNSWRDPPPPLDTSRYPLITKQDLERFLRIVGDGKYEQFLEDRDSLLAGQQQQMLLEGQGAAQVQGDGLAQAVQQVPGQYFQEDFSLHRPGVFESLVHCDDDDGVQQRIEQLGGYLDVVETQLMREISCRSRSMFEAAAVLQDLHRTLCQTLDRIKGLREHLSEMDEQTYTSALTVVSLQRRRRHLARTLEVLGGMEEVVAGRGALQCLLEGQDYAGALELLGNLRHMVERQLSMGIRAFRDTQRQVEETVEIVEGLLSCEFLGLARPQDMHVVMDRSIAEAAAAAADAASSSSLLPEEPPGSGGGGGGGSGGAGSAAPGGGFGGLGFGLENPGPAQWQGQEAAAWREQLHDKLLPVAVGLYRSGRLGAVLEQMRDNAAAEAKALVRETLERMVQPLLALAESGGGADAAGMAAGVPLPQPSMHVGADMQMAEQLQALPHSAFMQILWVVYRVSEAVLQYLCQLGQLLEDILRNGKAPQPVFEQARRGIALAVQAVADVTQGRCTRLLNARAASHCRLRLLEFRGLSEAAEKVLQLPERHGARGSGALRTTVQNQCRAYLESVLAKGLIQLQQLLETEQWTTVEVPPSMQAITDRLLARCSALSQVDAATFHPPSPHSPAASLGGASHTFPTPSGPLGAGAQPPASSAQLSVLGRSFPVVTSQLILIKLLDEYLQLHEAVPMFGAEVAQRSVELLQMFNTQTCQLVLGAGAIRTAGLKSISAKHLAVSCQAVHLVVVLLPALRAGLAAAVPQPRRQLLLPEFDRLIQDLTVHMDEIHSKLVDIMHDRLQMAVKQLAAESQSWGATAPATAATAATIAPLAAGAGAAGAAAGQEVVGDAVRGLVRSLGTLRSVLAPILQKEEISYLFGRVASLYSDTLAASLDALQYRGPAWEAVRQANASYLLQHLGELPLEPGRASAYLSRLSTFYTKHYGVMGDTKRPQQQQQPAQQQQVQQQQVQQPVEQPATPQPQQLQQQADLPMPPHSARLADVASAAAASEPQPCASVEHAAPVQVGEQPSASHASSYLHQQAHELQGNALGQGQGEQQGHLEQQKQKQKQQQQEQQVGEVAAADPTGVQQGEEAGGVEAQPSTSAPPDGGQRQTAFALDQGHVRQQEQQQQQQQQEEQQQLQERSELVPLQEHWQDQGKQEQEQAQQEREQTKQEQEHARQEQTEQEQERAQTQAQGHVLSHGQLELPPMPLTEPCAAPAPAHLAAVGLLVGEQGGFQGQTDREAVASQQGEAAEQAAALDAAQASPMACLEGDAQQQQQQQQQQEQEQQDCQQLEQQQQRQVQQVRQQEQQDWQQQLLMDGPAALGSEAAVDAVGSDEPGQAPTTQLDAAQQQRWDQQPVPLTSALDLLDALQPGLPPAAQHDLEQHQCHPAPLASALDLLGEELQDDDQAASRSTLGEVLQHDDQASSRSTLDGSTEGTEPGLPGTLGTPTDATEPGPPAHQPQQQQQLSTSQLNDAGSSAVGRSSEPGACDVAAAGSSAVGRGSEPGGWDVDALASGGSEQLGAEPSAGGSEVEGALSEHRLESRDESSDGSREGSRELVGAAGSSPGMLPEIHVGVKECPGTSQRAASPGSYELDSVGAAEQRSVDGYEQGSASLDDAQPMQHGSFRENGCAAGLHRSDSWRVEGSTVQGELEEAIEEGQASASGCGSSGGNGATATLVYENGGAAVKGHGMGTPPVPASGDPGAVAAGAGDDEKAQAFDPLGVGS